MNNIYKVIWSKAKNCYVVASEIARSHTKSASGSEKIGGGTRRKLLASLMALSLLCGGLGVASAADVVHVDETATGTAEVYTKAGVDTLLNDKADRTELGNKANATEVATNKANIANLENNKLSKADASITYATKADVNTELANKADKTYVDNALNDKADKADVYSKTDANNTFATKTELNAKANTDLSNLTADGVNKIKDTMSADMDLKANKAEVYSRTDAENTFATKTALDAKADTAALGEYAKTADVTTELEKKADKTVVTALVGRVGNLETTVNDSSNGLVKKVADLNKKTTKIGYDAANDITSVNGMKVGQQVDMGGKNLTNVGTINGIELGTKEGGNYISQDGSIWGNMKEVDTQVKTNADNIETNKNDITKLDTKVGTVGTGEYLDHTKSIGENLGRLDAGLKQEVEDREAAIGQLAVNGNYIEKDKNVSDNLVKLDNQVKANADAIVETDKRTGGIKQNTEGTQTTIEGKVTVDNSGNVGGVKGLSAETITTTGNASIGGDLKVAGTITTDKMVFGDKATNNYTEIDKGHITSKNDALAGDATKKSSSMELDHSKLEVGVADKDSNGHLTMTADKTSIKNSDLTEKNYSEIVADKDSVTTTVKDEKDNTTSTKSSATEIRNYAKDKDGNESSIVQTGKDITNTAEKGTITNEAQTIVNNATGDMTNTVGGKLNTTVTGQATENFNGGLDTNVTGTENHTVTGNQNIHVTVNQTNQIDGNQENTIGGNQTTNVTGDISNTAKNITNEAKTQLTDKVGDNTRVTTSDSITDTVGTANRKIENGKIIDTANDSTVTTENGKGTTFAKNGSTAYSTDAGAPKDTNIAGNHITTGRVDANELGVSDKDGANTADLSVKAGEGVKASAGNGTTTGSLDVKADEIGSSVTDASGKGSTFKQRIDAIMGNVKTDAGESEVTQKGDEITSVVGKGEATNSRVTQKKGSLEAAVTDGTNTNVSYDIANASAKVLTDGTKVNKLQDNLDSSEKTITNGTYTTSKVQTALDITNTAKDGTITNDAKNIVNNATGDMTNTVGGNQTNIIGGNQTTTVTGDISNKAKNITNEATEKLTDKVGDHTRVLDNEGITDTVGGSTFKQRIDKIMMESKDVSIKAEETLTNEAKVITNKASEVINNEAININNTATGIITSKASEIKNQADKLISNKVGENTWENMENGKITTSIKDGAKQNLTESNADGLKHAVTDGTSINASATTATSSAQTIVSGGKANSVITTIDGTQFVNSDAAAPVTGASGAGTADRTTIKGNTITTGKVKMDYAEVMKDLGVHGSAKVDNNLEVVGTSTLTGDVTMENNATVKKDLAVGGNANITGDVTANSYKVGDKTYISAAGINANDQKITNVADGSISEGSKDAVNGGQLYGVKRDLEHQVDKVGANAAAMANLRPMEFDPSSKWNIAAAIGNYGSETAAALGAFYRPNDDVMVNLSTAFGTGENMVGGGVSVRLGKSGNKLSREESNALKAQVNDLTARMDALLSVLNPNMSKDFPDVPENHWAYEAVSRLAGNDIVQGYPDGEFHGERTMTRYEMAEIIYNALSRGAEAERELVEEFKPELQAMAASEKATAEKAEG